jgi:protein-disulfide isomerase
MSQSRVIPIAILAAGAILSIALYIAFYTPHSGDNDNPSLVAPVTGADHIFGNPAAPVLIIEYADYTSPYCAAYDETLRQLIATEGATGKVAWVYRHFPLSATSTTALRHAEAAECAGQVAGSQGFWDFDEALYTSQPVDPSSYGALAASVGITTTDFAACLASASSTTDARIMSDRQNALDMGATGVPFTVILAQGHAPIALDGAYSYDALKQQVDSVLQ